MKSQPQRYTVTLDAYILARTDREALVKAALMVEEMRKKEDNQTQVISVESTPFGSVVSRLVHKGRLTLFNNKLIEI